MDIVSCHFCEDLTWLEGSPYPVHIVGKEGGSTGLYDSKKFASVDVIPNFAKEAGSYLWYIIKNYESLPERISFIHGHETSCHQKMTMFNAMKQYCDVPFVDLNRFVNFYCLILPDSVYPYRELWRILLEPFLGGCPKVLNWRGMAQFSVSRDLILSRPKEFWIHQYENARTLCRDDSTSFMVACFYEAVWHLIMGFESPLADESRPCLSSSNGMLVLNGRHAPQSDEYLDLFVDTDGEMYGPWGFIKKIAAMP